MKEDNSKKWLFFLLGLLIIVIDQLSKYWMISKEQLTIIPGFLDFTLVQNTGISFGLFQGTNWALIWIYLIVLGLMLFYYEHFSTKVEKFAYTLFLAGLLGNFLDRITHGFVVDFINLGWWPVFNIADSALVIAVTILVINELINLKKEYL